MISVHLQQVVTRLGVPGAFVEQLLEARIIEVDGDIVSERTVERIRVGWALHDEMGVNLEGVEVALHLLERLHDERCALAGDLSRLRGR